MRSRRWTISRRDDGRCRGSRSQGRHCCGLRVGLGLGGKLLLDLTYLGQPGKGTDTGWIDPVFGG